MKTETIEARYGEWRSPMQPAELLSRQNAPAYPFRHRGRLHWLEARAQEGGRLALMRAGGGDGDAPECMTPLEFNLRSGAHEYGGKCFCIFGDEIVFNNFGDARIYRQALSGGAPVAITAPPEKPGGGFADLISFNVGAVVAVRETVDGDALVAINLQSADAKHGRARADILADTADFYACPTVSPSQHEIAWIEWSDPYMPWDQSQLAAAELQCDGGVFSLRNSRMLFARDEHSVCQAGFFDERKIFFLADGGDDAGGDYWNFYCACDGEVQRITKTKTEYGEAHWQFGQCRWQRVGAKIIAVATSHDGDRLTEINPDSGDATPLAQTFATCSHLCADENELLFIKGNEDRDAEICKLHAGGETVTAITAITNTAGAGTETTASFPRALTYPTRDKKHAHAYFYAPHNKNYRAPRETLPPLLVVVHGGPTGRATPEWHPLKQYFASRGFAVLDINHRGSCGYGRAYRQKLLGNWGELDADDIADAVAHVLDEKLADPNLVFIRGGSAGGYAVLRALTRFPKLFCGGACYYGIGNLITLAQITHRFEGRYTDRLIGESFNESRAHDRDGKFMQRSPIFQIEKLRSPLILFQGLDDKVVPPAVSREVANALAKKNIAHEYIEYENEGHGFRKLATRVDALQRETEFFAKIIGENPAAEKTQS